MSMNAKMIDTIMGGTVLSNLPNHRGVTSGTEVRLGMDSVLVFELGLEYLMG